MPTLEEFCTVRADLGMNVIGRVPIGTRIDFPFEGTATGPHWDGDRPVRGIDYVTVRADGNMDLDIRGLIGQGNSQVAYRGSGVSVAHEDRSASPRELITFQTADETLAWLNTEIAVAFGHGAEGKLTLDVYLVRP